MAKQKLKLVRKLFRPKDGESNDASSCSTTAEVSPTCWSLRSCSMSSNEVEQGKSYQDLKMFVDQRRQERQGKDEIETALLQEAAKQRSFERIMNPSTLPDSQESPPPRTLIEPEPRISETRPAPDISAVQKIQMKRRSSPRSHQSFTKTVEEPPSLSFDDSLSLDALVPTSSSFELEKDEEGTEVVLKTESLNPPPARRRFTRLSLRKSKKKKKKNLYSLSTVVIPISDDREVDRYATDAGDDGDKEDEIEIMRRGAPSPDVDLDRYSTLSEFHDEEEDSITTRTRSQFRGDDNVFFANIEFMGHDWSDDEHQFEIRSLESAAVDDKIDSFKHKNFDTEVDDWDYADQRGRASVTDNSLDTDDVIVRAREDDGAPAKSCIPLP